MTVPAGVLDLRAVEARHPATVTLAAGEHHSQDVRERIQAHVDVAALLAHCRALRAALEKARNTPQRDALPLPEWRARCDEIAAVLAAARDGEDGSP